VPSLFGRSNNRGARSDTGPQLSCSNGDCMDIKHTTIEHYSISRALQWSFMPVAMAVVFFILLTGCSNSDVPAALRSVIVNPPKQLDAFELVDHKQNTVNLERLKNHWSFLFFGFTNCPDVCPATLTQLIQVKKLIMDSPNSSDNLQFLFVSVDPQRDTQQHLASYMAYFDAAFLGMTGDEDKIVAFENQLGAFHRYGIKNTLGYYSVQHSAEVFLIDPAGRLAAKFQPPMEPSQVAEQFTLFVHRYSEKVT